MEVSSPNKSTDLCSSHEYALAEEKKSGLRDNSKRREEERNSVGLNQCGMNQKPAYLSV